MNETTILNKTPPHVKPIKLTPTFTPPVHDDPFTMKILNRFNYKRL